MSDGGGVISGPWRATRLWNEIVRSFHAGMPCKRHRVRMKTVENCFSGAEAVDWLHKSLKKNPNFGQDVSKEQTVQLLQKILRAGIVECVHSSSSGSQNREVLKYSIIFGKVRKSENVHYKSIALSATR